MSLFKAPSSITMQQEFLERSLKSELCGSKFLSSISIKEEQLSLQKDMDEHRDREAKTFLRGLCTVVTSIKQLKENISSEESIHRNDMSYFQSTFMNIEETLAVLSTQIKERTLCLCQEEEELQYLISTLIQKTHASSEPELKTSPSLSVHVRPQVSTSSAYDSMHPDIQEFQDFLQKSGGHTGGWSTEDHLLFLKLIQKRRGISDVVSTLLDQIPGKCEEDMNEHETWYRQYLILKEAHRQALADWRRNRDEREALKKNQEEKTSSLPEIPRYMVDPDRSQELKVKVAQWKDRQDEKRREAEEKILCQKKQEEEKWKRKMAYFERQRALLQERKKEKEAVNTEKEKVDGLTSKQMKELEEVQKRYECGYLKLKDYREQDLKFVRRRLSRMEQQRQKREVPRTRSSSFSTSAKRDPSRLLQPTAIWKIRLNRSLSECGQKEDLKRNPCFIDNIPRL